jgi:hypothetical protein
VEGGLCRSVQDWVAPVLTSPTGQFDESDDGGRSLRQDVKRKAKTVVKSGQGDKGDQKRKPR